MSSTQSYAWLRPSLQSILDRNDYPAYAEEVEGMRQKRMASRLEWRRQQRITRRWNRLAQAAIYTAIAFASLGAVVLFSELLRLVVWTVLR